MLQIGFLADFFFAPCQDSLLQPNQKETSQSSVTLRKQQFPHPAGEREAPSRPL